MQAIKLARKYPQFTQEDMLKLVDQFNQIDLDSTGRLPKSTVLTSLSTQATSSSPAGKYTYDAVRETLKTVSLDSSGQVELEDWVDLVDKLKSGAGASAGQVLRGGALSGLMGAPAPSSGGGKHQHTSSVGGGGGKVLVQGSNTNITHSINEDERTEFTRHINQVLASDPDIGDRLPIPTDTFQIFDECRDGLLLSKLINDSVPDTIDERVLNKASKKAAPSAMGKSKATLNSFQMTENNNLVITSAKSLGLSVVNIGATDLNEGREHLILGLIWQVIRRGLLAKIDIKLHPELYRLLEEDETLDQFLRLPPDQILLRWFNYHLKAANWGRRVANFSKDVSDGENYTVLLNQLKPNECSRAPLQEKDLHQRAEKVLQNADSIGCRKYLTPTSLVAGNSKLNLAFVANLFNTWPGLEPLEENERPEIEDFDAEGEREARVFTLWLNSLDVEPGVYDLFEDLKDGLVLLQAFDRTIPGSVIQRRVAKSPLPLSRFKAVENTNYALDLARQNHMHIVGIQGADIVDGQRTLTLGLVWQMMRRSVLGTLESLSKDGKGISDSEIVRWANDQVKKGGKGSSMRSFKDSGLKDAKFFLDLLDALKPGYVDYGLVYEGRTSEECKANAKLAISIARKLGSLIYLVPEDIVEVRPRLVLTFCAALMAWQSANNRLSSRTRTHWTRPSGKTHSRLASFQLVSRAYMKRPGQLEPLQDLRYKASQQLKLTVRMQLPFLPSHLRPSLFPPLINSLPTSQQPNPLEILTLANLQLALLTATGVSVVWESARMWTQGRRARAGAKEVKAGGLASLDSSGDRLVTKTSSNDWLAVYLPLLLSIPTPIYTGHYVVPQLAIIPTPPSQIGVCLVVPSSPLTSLLFLVSLLITVLVLLELIWLTWRAAEKERLALVSGWEEEGIKRRLTRCGARVAREGGGEILLLVALYAVPSFFLQQRWLTAYSYVIQALPSFFSRVDLLNLASLSFLPALPSLLLAQLVASRLSERHLGLITLATNPQTPPLTPSFLTPSDLAQQQQQLAMAASQATVRKNGLPLPLKVVIHALCSQQRHRQQSLEGDDEKPFTALPRPLKLRDSPTTKGARTLGSTSSYGTGASSAADLLPLNPALISTPPRRSPYPYPSTPPTSVPRNLPSVSFPFPLSVPQYVPPPPPLLREPSYPPLTQLPSPVSPRLRQLSQSSATSAFGANVQRKQGRNRSSSVSVGRVSVVDVFEDEEEMEVEMGIKTGRQIPFAEGPISPRLEAGGQVRRRRGSSPPVERMLR
ncbi:hypothetical protein JCM11641_001026 [Rhodosporidiobolus odoratus]